MPSPLQNAWMVSEQFYRDIFRNRNEGSYNFIRGRQSRNGVYTHDGQPGTGKTKSLAKIIKETENDRKVYQITN